MLKIIYIPFLVYFAGIFQIKGQDYNYSSEIKNLNYGIKANGYVAGIVGIDYSLFVQYKFMSIFGGYSSVFDYKIGNIYKVNCFNTGLNIRGFQTKRKNGVYFYLYYTQGTTYNPSPQTGHYIGGTYLPGTYYEGIFHSVIIGPRYRVNFLRNIMSIEFGPFFNFCFIKEYFHLPDYPIIDYNKGFLGIQMSLAFNLSSLFVKR